MTESIRYLIEKYEEEGQISYSSISAEQIVEAENVLGLKLPQEYLQFLKEFGSGGIGDVDVYGVDKDGSLGFLNVTLNHREKGLPANLIVLEDLVNQQQYCIDCDNGNVVIYRGGKVTAVYDNFDNYLFERYIESAVNE